MPTRLPLGTITIAAPHTDVEQAVAPALAIGTLQRPEPLAPSSAGCSQTAYNALSTLRQLAFRFRHRQGTRMHIGLRCDPASARGWHARLIARLQDDGHAVTVVPLPSKARARWPDRLLTFEARLRSAEVDAMVGSAMLVAGTASGPMNVVIDLEGKGAPDHAEPVWHVTANGASGISAILAAAVQGCAPLVAIRQGETVLAAGRVGSESPDLLQEHAAGVLGGCATLLLAALRGQAPVLQSLDAMPPTPLGPGRAAGLAATIAGRRVARRIYRQIFRTPHWRVGWRRLAGPDLIDLRRHPDEGWRELPDDGHHFYADPFPILRGGQVTLFVEDYVHATGRGRIAAVPFGPGGPLGQPEPVLERPYHLSYPFVFEHDGDTWMIPETGEAQTVELFRATAFPAGWVKEADLLTGVVAGDVTLHEADDGRWWMFATVRDGGAASDALHLWSAPEFRGPWTPHRHNPVLVDIAAARPAGRMVTRGGALIRPVQDCRAGYGAALGLARVERLDDSGFSQVVETIIGPGPRWPGRCLHTLNSAGGFEFIDGSGRARRPWGERRSS